MTKFKLDFVPDAEKKIFLRKVRQAQFFISVKDVANPTVSVLYFVIENF